MPGEGLGDLTTVSLVMDGLQHYDWEVSRITFNFWFRLCENLVQNESSVVKFNIIFETLLQALTRLCQVRPRHLYKKESDSRTLKMALYKIY